MSNELRITRKIERRFGNYNLIVEKRGEEYTAVLFNSSSMFGNGMNLQVTGSGEYITSVFGLITDMMDALDEESKARKGVSKTNDKQRS